MKLVCLCVNAKDTIPAHVRLPIHERGDLLERLSALREKPGLIKMTTNELVALRELSSVVTLELIAVTGLIAEMTDLTWQIATKPLETITIDQVAESITTGPSDADTKTRSRSLSASIPRDLGRADDREEGSGLSGTD